jgi:hypothetical protein
MTPIQPHDAYVPVAEPIIRTCSSHQTCRRRGRICFNLGFSTCDTLFFVHRWIWIGEAININSSPDQGSKLLVTGKD